MTMGVINAVAQFERDLIIERTQSGLACAKAAGRKLGRPVSVKLEQRTDVIQQLAAGISISAVARTLKLSRATIMRVRNGAAAASA
jgi:putative DNA-invertase from lambdoid prophage Rac